MSSDDKPVSTSTVLCTVGVVLAVGVIGYCAVKHYQSHYMTPETINNLVIVEENVEINAIVDAPNENNNNQVAVQATETTSTTTTPVTAMEGSVQAIYLGTDAPNGTNLPGEYRFTLTDSTGQLVPTNVEFAYSIAPSSDDSSCLHINAENYTKFTYTSRDTFTVMQGTLCVAALAKNATGDVIAFGNASFDVGAESVAGGKKPKKKNALFSLLRRRAKRT